MGEKTVSVALFFFACLCVLMIQSTNHLCFPVCQKQKNKKSKQVKRGGCVKKEGMDELSFFLCGVSPTFLFCTACYGKLFLTLSGGQF